jgi:hypothetical protein
MTGVTILKGKEEVLKDSAETFAEEISVVQQNSPERADRLISNHPHD